MDIWDWIIWKMLALDAEDDTRQLEPINNKHSLEPSLASRWQIFVSAVVHSSYYWILFDLCSERQIIMFSRHRLVVFILQNNMLIASWYNTRPLSKGQYWKMGHDAAADWSLHPLSSKQHHRLSAFKFKQSYILPLTPGTMIILVRLGFYLH